MKQKIAIVGHGTPSELSDRLLKLIDEQRFEVVQISPEEAQKLNFREPMTIPIMPLNTCDMPFHPPMTRRERRALKRKKQ